MVIWSARVDSVSARHVEASPSSSALPTIATTLPLPSGEGGGEGHQTGNCPQNTSPCSAFRVKIRTRFALGSST